MISWLTCAGVSLDGAVSIELETWRLEKHKFKKKCKSGGTMIFTIN